MTAPLPPSKPLDPPSSSKSRRGKWWAKWLLAVASVGLMLGLAEMYLRTWSPDRLGFEYVDGEFRTPQELLPDDRDRSAPPTFGPKAPGATRIALLGDSYVWGLGCPEATIVGNRLQHHLNEKGAGTFEVVSMGRPGWSQVDQLRALQSLGERLQPDLVITLFLPLNDVRENSNELNAIASAQYEQMTRFRPGWLQLPKEDAPWFLWEGSRLNQFLSYQLAVRASRRDPTIPIDYQVFATEPGPEWQKAWDETLRLLQRTIRYCEKLGVGYALAVASTPQGILGNEAGLAELVQSYPAMADGSYDLDLPASKVEAFCEEREIPFLNLESEFRERVRRTGEVLHFPFDGHWNIEGHEAAGQRMAEFVGSSIHEWGPGK